MKTKRKLLVLAALLAMLMLASIMNVNVFAEKAPDIENIAIDTGATVSLKDKDSDGYYEIANADELYAFAAAVKSGKASINGELTGDITVNEKVLAKLSMSVAFTEPLREWTPIGTYEFRYAGTFDGAGHTISGLYLESNDAGNIGLFGEINAGTVKNMRVADSYFNGNSFIGGIAGLVHEGTIENCTSEATVSGLGDSIGGIAGVSALRSTIVNCTNTGAISGDTSVGGITGTINDESAIENCTNKGAVNGNYQNIGGIAGDSQTNSTIINCVNIGNVSGDTSVGGIAGNGNSGGIINCMNVGDIISMSELAGSIIGYNELPHDINIINCYYLADGETDDVENTTAKNAAEFASGEVAWLLGDAFGQELSERGDVYPVLLTEKNKEKSSLYRSASGELCTGEYFYTNVKEDAVSAKHDENAEMINGICPHCGVFEPLRSLRERTTTVSGFMGSILKGMLATTL